MQSGTSGDDILFHSKKRRRTSGRSGPGPNEPLEANNALSTEPGGLMTSTSPRPQTGSPRDMSGTDGPGAVKYTRTGRVSKATKGQRVHQCDECGKVRTVFQLFRHQLRSSPSHLPLRLWAAAQTHDLFSATCSSLTTGANRQNEHAMAV